MGESENFNTVFRSCPNFYLKNFLTVMHDTYSDLTPNRPSKEQQIKPPIFRDYLNQNMQKKLHRKKTNIGKVFLCCIA